MAAKQEEIELEDILQGARTVDPNISIQDLLKFSANSEELDRIFKNANEFRFLITGQTGVGKSTLINGLIGKEVAEVGDGVEASGVTTEVKPYHKIIDEVDVLVYDSPGLEDGSGNEKKYLDELYKKCHDAHLFIFAVRLTNRFVPNNPDVLSMVKFTDRFGPKTWEKAIVIITCANLVEALNPQALLHLKSSKEKKEYFQKLMGNYKSLIHKALIKDAKVPADIVECVKVVPTGIESEKELMDGTLWFTNFWFECLRAMPKVESRATLIKVNAKRFKTSKFVASEDFSKPLQDQPIVVQERKVEFMIKEEVLSQGSVLASVFVPALTGAAVGTLGLLGGPIGLLAIPIGFFGGMVIGAIATAVRKQSSK